ncbi:MAG: tRNA (N(6)-L-threonylcarbamoyladenosine(37)-C(2))-methylthiotransferase MtaB [Bacteroidetes bacterium]|nr:MAG: tRNA (N(6)-L-threonylcarbamoyladenosine(37)-C(2))-methylthiotransferase MtaB [Bacteroidota bacterium]
MKRGKIKIAFKTLGCKLNFSESSEIGRALTEKGYEIIPPEENADYYIIHSCTVTSLAEKKARQAARHFKKNNPNAKVGIMGCYVQLRAEELEALPEIDFTANNETKYHLPEILEGVYETAPSPTMSYHSAYSLNDRTRSFLKVQDGCDYRCTYCAVSAARGKSRSDTIDHVLHEAQQIIKEGVKEIVLTGVNVGDFGRGNRETLYDLLRALEQLKGITRLRLSSIEPNLLEHRIIDLVAASKVIMPHFHIPLQSGSDEVLQKMRRRYNTELFHEKTTYIKQQIPHACIAADVITGFPGESDAHFETTCRFIKRLPLSYLHVFTYSDRPDTPALKIMPKVPPATKQQRSKQLHTLSNQLQMDFYRSHKGDRRTALFEEAKGEYLYGWTDNYIRIKTSAPDISPNTIHRVSIGEVDSEGVAECTPTPLVEDIRY